uniref:Uncharacterized protein n=1 Tax=Amphora coffeiformis TaxID=265554 RepID=A0A7S3L6D6_9STRA
MGIRDVVYECEIKTNCDDSYIWCAREGTQAACLAKKGCYWDTTGYGMCFGDKDLSCDTVVTTYMVTKEPSCVSSDCPCNTDMIQYVLDTKAKDLEDLFDKASCTGSTNLSQNPVCLAPLQTQDDNINNNNGDNNNDYSGPPSDGDCAAQTEWLESHPSVGAATRVVNDENQCESNSYCNNEHSGAALEQYRNACNAAGGVYMGLLNTNLQCDVMSCQLGGYYCIVHTDVLTCNVAPGCAWIGNSCVADTNNGPSCSTSSFRAVSNEIPLCIGPKCSCNANAATLAADAVVATTRAAFAKNDLEATCSMTHKPNPHCVGENSGSSWRHGFGLLAAFLVLSTIVA